ncbi:MAG: hypothetical protein ThorAB25_16830 [Candidatus Thorarchaeota archaeon AB_25]|nr:MAG: hypothetical protein ThorAB25_16830 [Candidatus Thorarchaeota archaeon AB_25]
MNPTTVPGHSMVYADTASQTIMFGVQLMHENNAFNSEIWACDHDSDTWTEVTVPTGDAFNPTLVILGAGFTALVLIVLIVYVKKC